MKGLPFYFQTRSDWENAFDYAMKHPSVRGELISRLKALKASQTIKVLKPGVSKPPEELMPEDFEDTPDLASPFARSGFTDAEIEQMLSRLKQ